MKRETAMRMRRAYRSNRSIPQIAKTFGVSWSTVHRALTSDPNYKPRSPGRQPGVTSERTTEMAKEARKMRGKGMTWSKIGESFGVSAGYASRIARKF